MTTTDTTHADAALIAAASSLAAAHAGVIILEKIRTDHTEDELGAALDRRFDAAYAVARAPTARTIDGAAATARSLRVVCEALTGAEWEDTPVEALITHLVADVESLRGTVAA
jgi:hypothetical protein